MKTLLKTEELLMFGLGIYLFSLLSMNWWWFIGCILLPDIGMLGYLINTKIGALTYNICHHRGIAIVCYLLGIYLQNEALQFIGIILFAHAAMDRIFGYGLKFSDSFKNTHLGTIGK